MRNKKIAVSVIVPVYNAEKTLKKCLNSIIEQTLKNIEIILIDDGSTDGSSIICKNYAENDERILYYQKENEGLAAARQDGIDRANGIYVGFVDSDDWIEPNMYEKMCSRAEEHNADIVFCNCFFDEAERDKTHLETGIYDRKAIEANILPRSLSGINDKGNNSVIRWSNCLRIYRLELIKKNNIAFDRRFRRSQDLQLTFETTLCANTYVSINDEYLYHNRTLNNANSLSRGYTKNYWSLIRPLIDRLYYDVNIYIKQNLMNEMHLCAFFFAASGVKNEYENKSFPIHKRIKKIDEIVKDEVIQKAIPFIEHEKLSDYYKMIYRGLCSRNAYKIMWMYFMFNMRKNVLKPIARKIKHRNK